MKMSGSKRITACLVTAAMAAMLVSAVPAVAAESGGTADGFTYVLAEDGSATITRYNNLEATTVLIPEMLNGHVVKRLYYRALSLSNAVSISLPKTLEAITGESEAPKGMIFAPNSLNSLESYEVRFSLHIQMESLTNHILFLKV